MAASEPVRAHAEMQRRLTAERHAEIDAQGLHALLEFGRREIGVHQHEFVAGVAHQPVGIGEAVAQRIGEALQAGVADVVPVLVR